MQLIAVKLVPTWLFDSFHFELIEYLFDVWYACLIAVFHILLSETPKSHDRERLFVQSFDSGDDRRHPKDSYVLGNIPALHVVIGGIPSSEYNHHQLR